jgi:hypothetical protein
MSKTPTERTREYLEDRNSCLADLDNLWGFVQLLEVDDLLKRIVAISCTSQSRHDSVVLKILRNQDARRWVSCGGSIEVWSWRTRKIGGAPEKRHWVRRVEEITEAMFEKLASV